MSASPPRHRLAPPIPPAPGLAVEADEIVFAHRFAMQRVRFRYPRFDGSLSGLLTWELWRRGRGVQWRHRGYSGGPRGRGCVSPGRGRGREHSPRRNAPKNQSPLAHRSVQVSDLRHWVFR